MCAGAHGAQPGVMDCRSPAEPATDGSVESVSPRVDQVLHRLRDHPDKYAQRSSLDGLLATRVPLWVGSAELDPPQFKEQADLLREGLRKAGRSFPTAVFAGHSHMSEAYSIHSDDRSVGDALMAFVNAQ
jgi:hypothetical protein